MKIEAFRNVRVGLLFGRVLIRLRRFPEISTKSSVEHFVPNCGQRMARYEATSLKGYEAA